MAKARVLTADDNKGVREIACSLLSGEFDVIQALDDGSTALAAQAFLPDVAILDIAMPVLNGLEVARLIKATIKVRVVFLTVAELFQAAREAGSVGYVLKPRLCTDLVTAIKGALNYDRFTSAGLG
jgi:CheY-like chemotaxis protein